jgi:hypothetical protein
MSDGEGEDTFWGDRRDRRRRGRRSNSHSPSNRRSPSPPRSPAAKRYDQRRASSPSHRNSRPRGSPSPSRRHAHQRHRDSPSPSRRPRSPRSSGRHVDRPAPSRSGESRYDDRDRQFQCRRSPSPYRNSRSQHSANDSRMRPRSRSRDRRSPPPRGLQQHEQRHMPDPMHAPTMIGSRDFKCVHCHALRCARLTPRRSSGHGSFRPPPAPSSGSPGLLRRTRRTARRTRSARFKRFSGIIFARSGCKNGEK